MSRETPFGKMEPSEREKEKEEVIDGGEVDENKLN